KNRLSCTLFGETVDQILPHLDDDQLELLIVVFQYFKATRWNGKTSVQSHIELSKVHVNPELKEVMSFKKRSVHFEKKLNVFHQSTQSSWAGTDELNNGTTIVKAIEEILKSVEGAKEDEYLKSLDNMMDRMVLFKINVKNGNIKHYDKIYTVMKVCDDEEIVAKTSLRKWMLAHLLTSLRMEVATRWRCPNMLILRVITILSLLR
ncbi:hypothetical protein S83_031444, partial [Arachis hypogaea]